jgi:hypothetical protein
MLKQRLHLQDHKLHPVDAIKVRELGEIKLKVCKNLCVDGIKTTNRHTHPRESSVKVN